MVTGNEDHDQNVVGHLCMNEPKKKTGKKRKTKLELSGTTPECQEICSPNQLPDHGNSGRGNPKRSTPDGWARYWHEALEEGRKETRTVQQPAADSFRVIHSA